MRLKLLIFSFLAMADAAIFAQEEEICLLDTLVVETVAHPTAYEQRVKHRRERWLDLCPSLGIVQYAGDMGMISAGFGWDYGRRERWETHVAVGFLPKELGPNADVMLTLRENLVPWSFGLGRRTWADPQGVGSLGNPLPWSRRAAVSFEPAVFSVFINTIFDDEFWIHEPDKYNGGSYYRFPSKIRFHAGLGSRFSLNIPQARRRHFDRVSFYYVLSTYDLAIINALPNEKISLGDILTLGFGVQYKFF